MPSWLGFQVSRLGRELWVVTTVYCLLAVAAALFAVLFAPFVPEGMVKLIGGDAVDKVLGVLAASMLTVAIFSLTTISTVYATAAATATPRAVSLIVEDSSAQQALAVFIGAFLYSLVGLIALSTGYYSGEGRAILFLMTLFVIGAVIVTLVRWIHALTHLGRMSDTIDRLEAATLEAVEARIRSPRFGAQSATMPPENAHRLFPDCVGYIQYVDAKAIETWAADHDAIVHVLALPGSQMHPARALMAIEGPHVDEAAVKALLSAIVIGDRRTFESDPRFGLIGLSEIASRALSSAINDPGTAIDVISAQLRILMHWAACASEAEKPEPAHSHMRVPDFDIGDVFEDAFSPVARDGAAMAEVMIALLKAMDALAATQPDFRQTALRHAGQILERAEDGIESEFDLARVREAARTPRLCEPAA